MGKGGPSRRQGALTDRKAPGILGAPKMSGVQVRTGPSHCRVPDPGDSPDPVPLSSGPGRQHFPGSLCGWHSGWPQQGCLHVRLTLGLGVWEARPEPLAVTLGGNTDAQRTPLGDPRTDRKQSCRSLRNAPHLPCSGGSCPGHGGGQLRGQPTQGRFPRGAGLQEPAGRLLPADQLPGQRLQVPAPRASPLGGHLPSRLHYLKPL